MGCGCTGAPNGYAQSTYDSLTPQIPVKECAEQELKKAEENYDPVTPVGGKIENVTIVFECNPPWTINQQLRMSPGSEPVHHWSWDPSADFDFDANTGKLSGSTLPSPGKTKVFNITFKAHRADNSVIDERTYKIVAEECKDGIKIIHPLPGSTMTSGCSTARKHPVTGQVKQHKGCDFAYPGRVTKDVLCVADGTVVAAVKMHPKAGNFVEVEHRNSAGKKLCKTRYLHLDSIYVSNGAKVTSGQPLGKEGNTGVGTGPHLHFELRGPNDEVWDPMEYIGGKKLIGEGEMRADGSTDQSNPVSSTPASQTSAQVTPGKAANPCESSPVIPPPQPVTPVTVPGDCLDRAFVFVMKEEVGSWFDPSDPVTAAGCVGSDPKTANKKCGLVTIKGDAGGKTKFGIASKFNGNVDNLDLTGAKEIFKSKYYVPSGAHLANSCKKSCLIVSTFFHCYSRLDEILALLTPKASRNSMVQALNPMSDDEFIEKFSAARLEVLKKTQGWKTFSKGFTNRVNHEKSRAKTVSA